MSSSQNPNQITPRLPSWMTTTPQQPTIAVTTGLLPGQITNALILGAIGLGGLPISYTDLGWINVKDPTYGAKGDGATDDSGAINLAITAASLKGAVVYLPTGTYLINNPLVVANPGVYIRGDGRTATRIIPGASLGDNNFIMFNGPNVGPPHTLTDVGVCDLTIDGTNGNAKNYCGFAAGLYSLNVDKLIIERVRFLNIPGFGIFNVNGVGGFSNPNLRTVIQNCEFIGCGAGSSMGTITNTITPGVKTISFAASLPPDTHAAYPYPPTGPYVGGAFYIDLGLATEEKVIITSFTSNSITATFAYGHSIGAIVTGLRADSVGGGGGQQGSVIAQNYFSGCWGNAIDQTATEDAVWIGNTSESSNTGPNYPNAGSIVADFSLVNSVIGFNTFRNSGGIIVGDNGGASYGNLVVGNRLYSSSNILFLTANNAGTFVKNYGNQIICNYIDSPPVQQSGITVQDNLDMVIANNYIRNTLYISQSCNMIQLAPAANASSAITVTVHGNRFVDDRAVAGNSTYSIYETNAKVIGEYLDNTFALSGVTGVGKVLVNYQAPGSVLRNNRNLNNLGAIIGLSLVAGTAYPNIYNQDIDAYLSFASTGAGNGQATINANTVAVAAFTVAGQEQTCYVKWAAGTTLKYTVSGAPVTLAAAQYILN